VNEHDPLLELKTQNIDIVKQIKHLVILLQRFRRRLGNHLGLPKLLQNYNVYLGVMDKIYEESSKEIENDLLHPKIRILFVK